MTPERDGPASVLMSLKPRYADAIANGRKTIELRRRRPGFAPGTRVWVYATAPVAGIVGQFTSGQVESLNPIDPDIASLHGADITAEEWRSYFRGRTVAYGLQILEFIPIPVRLRLPAGMRPPRMYCYLGTQHPLHRELLHALADCGADYLGSVPAPDPENP